MQTKQQFTTDLNTSLSFLNEVEAANIPSLQNRFYALGLDLVINYDLMVAKVEKLKSKAFIQKPVLHIRFRSFARLIEYCDQWISNREAIKAGEDKKKAIKKEALKEMAHDFKVGDILYDSWGWEQTNIDFYQITEVLKGSVKLRPISDIYAPNQEGNINSMAAYVIPVRDNFTGPEVLKKINAMVNYNGSVSYYIKSKHGWISRHVENEKHYSSWYA
jgi:hypothetical protein